MNHARHDQSHATTGDPTVKTPPRLWPVPVVAFLVIWGLTTHGKYSVSGDEPHYLMMTESLRASGDLDLSDQYASGASSRFGHDNLRIDGHAKIDARGELTSIHEPGVAVLVLPVYDMARRLAGAIPEASLKRFRMGSGLFAYSIVSLFMLGVACWALYFLIATLSVHATPTSARLAGLLVALSPPFLSTSFLVFPEIPAFWVVTVVLWTSYGPGRARMWSPCATAFLIGMLPWFHRKFSVFAVGLLFVLLWSWRTTLRRSWTTGIGWATICAAPTVAFFVYSMYRWGSVAGPVAADGVPLSLSVFLAGAPGLLVDRENGLLAWAPIYAIVGAAAWVARRHVWPLAVPSALLYGLSASHDLWWGGFAPAGRFLLPLVPFLAYCLARALASRPFRRALAVLTVPQVLISAVAWQNPRGLWPLGDGHHRILERLPLGNVLSSAWPSLRTTEPHAVLVSMWTLALLAVNVWLIVRMTAHARTQQSVIRPGHDLPSDT